MVPHCIYMVLYWYSIKRYNMYILWYLKALQKEIVFEYLKGRRIRYRIRDANKLGLRDYWVPND